MYQHKVSAFGQFAKHTIQDASGNNSLSLAPGSGACVLDLTLDGVSLLDVYDTPLDMDINKWCKNLLLFPFPNRLKEGSYQWGGEQLQFDINDTITNNALHGLGMKAEMAFVKTELKQNMASITCTYDYQGDDEGYPFPFHFTVTFQIENGGLFSGTFLFVNKSDRTIPVGLGWHPYFKLDEDISNVELHLPPCEMVGVDEYMIPTGKRYFYDEFAAIKKIGATVLDNCFALKENSISAVISLNGTKGQIRFWQDAGPGKFNFLQVFTPPHRRSIAIEPMTCNIDAFNNEEGLVTLEPGEDWRLNFGLTFQK